MGKEKVIMSLLRVSVKKPTRRSANRGPRWSFLKQTHRELPTMYLYEFMSEDIIIDNI